VTERKEVLMTIAAERLAHGVSVCETPHELRVEIELPEGEPHFILSTTSRGLEIRVFRPLEPVLPWHSNPNATPT